MILREIQFGEKWWRKRNRVNTQFVKHELRINESNKSIAHQTEIRQTNGRRIDAGIATFDSTAFKKFRMQS